MTELGVNVDHVATVREARGIDVPDPVKAAFFAEQSGADGITVHLRKDRRHIQERDVRLLEETVKSRLNLEMANTDAMRSLARDLTPGQVTLVPEERDEVTTEGGLDVAGNREQINEGIQVLNETIPTVSLFVDPDQEQLDASLEVGADAVELHTGDYAETKYRSDERKSALGRLQRAADHAESIGLTCFAGHGLNYRNVKPVAALEPVEELNIGHALVSRAVMVGFEKATRQMKELMEKVS
jgi:pyridoxine 5-phosphate synthase